MNRFFGLVMCLLLTQCRPILAQSSNLQGANTRLDAASYELKAQKGAASGYAPLNSSSLIPPAYLFPSFSGSSDGTIWVKSGSTLIPVPSSGISAAGDALTLGTVIIGNPSVGSTRGIA